jgi:hypothetical protein
MNNMNERQGVKAIQTAYKGYRFRSRLEARWAVFMDALGLHWEYERQGFDLGEAGRYLPDFWVRELQHWVEIKPSIEEGKNWPDMTKQGALAKASGFGVVTLCGTPGPIDLNTDTGDYMGFVAFAAAPAVDPELADYLGDILLYDCFHYWCECPYCGAIGIQYTGRSDRNIHKPDCHSPNDNKYQNVDSPRLLAAYDAARSARFEFGEHGARG